MASNLRTLDYDDFVHALDRWLGTETELYVLSDDESPPNDDRDDYDPTDWVLAATVLRVFGRLRRESEYFESIARRDGEPLELTERRAVAYSFEGMDNESGEFLMLEIFRKGWRDARWF